MITIRRAKKEEAEVIARYQVLMADESEGMLLDYETVHRGVNAVFDDPKKGFYLSAEWDGLLVGSLLITLEWSDWRAQMLYWIQSLYVEPEHRRKGIFTSMYGYLKKEIAEKGDVAGIRLYVDLGNTKAIETYKALGMNGEHYQLFEDVK